MLTSQPLYAILLGQVVILVAFTYKPLWKMLIDKDMTKRALMSETSISKSTMDKMGRGELVSLEVIDRICNYFECGVADVMEHCAPRKETRDE